QKNPQTNIFIIGHTDNSGTPDHNVDLSLRRAVSVKEYLTSVGIDASRLNTQGKGETEPVVDNGTPDGRAQNRRVEIVILANAKMKAQATQGQK
ncbi:MAG TPA: OmpA family protein, partial [Mucilaginibacter sp.]|nr:OmpA family protein [Mucilaginibacter sp.]